MSSHNATASCQSTSPQRTPSRNPVSQRTLGGLRFFALSPALHLRSPSLSQLSQDNACAFPGHLLTVEMLPGPARDGSFL